MVGARQKRPGDAKRGSPPWVVLGSAIAIVLGGIGTSTCGIPGASIDECDDTTDCGLPGTICNGDYCTCPTVGDAFCMGACRPLAECMMDGGSSGGGGGAGSGGTCQTAANCPQPGDPHCGRATCENGVCGLDLTPFSALSSQVRGDCKELWCDGDGNLVEVKEASDTYNDGAQCTEDLCLMGEALEKPYSNGLTCPETSEGVCYQGDCVACIADMVTCDGGFVCDGVRCVAMHCVNDQWDQGLGETWEDCGGPCGSCPTGLPCKAPTDCRHGVCTGGVCQPPTCSDGVKNDNETGADCGGPPNCPRCTVGQGCKMGSDCESKVCWAGACEPPTCTDGIRNGDETDWDCGGSCAPCP